MNDDDEKKRFSDFAKNWLSCKSRQINFEYFGTSEVVFAKSEKNPIPSFFSKKNYFGFPLIFFLQGNSL